MPRMMCVRYRGRDFTLEDLIAIRAISAAQPHRAAIAWAVSQHLGWSKPYGGLTAASCALALWRMHADGWIDLAPPVHPAPPEPKAPPFTAASDPQLRIEGLRGDLSNSVRSGNLLSRACWGRATCEGRIL